MKTQSEILNSPKRVEVKHTCLLRYILHKSGLAGSNLTLYRERKSSGGSTEKLTQSYFATLPPKVLQGLKKFYEADFKAFGYDMDLYG